MSRWPPGAGETTARAQCGRASRPPPQATERDLVDNELGFPENPLALVRLASRHLCPSLRRALCGHLDRPGTSVPSSLLPERREKGLSELPDSAKPRYQGVKVPHCHIPVRNSLGGARRIAGQVEVANRGDSVQGLRASVFLPAVSWTQLSAAAASARDRLALTEEKGGRGEEPLLSATGIYGVAMVYAERRCLELWGRVLRPRAGWEDREGRLAAGEPFLSGFRGREQTPSCGKKGWNHPARRRRVGRRHLTARPRPPRVRGGGSVCSVTNGPSRPARPLARARRGPARERSSRRLPASRRPARSRPAVPANPRGRSWHPARRLARGGRAGRLDRGGARLAFPQHLEGFAVSPGTHNQMSFDMVDGDSSPACEWWFKPAKRLQTCGDRGLKTSQGDILGAPWPGSAGGNRTFKAEKAHHVPAQGRPRQPRVLCAEGQWGSIQSAPATGSTEVRRLARCGGAAGVVNQAVANQRTATSQHQGHTPPQAALPAPAPMQPPPRPMAIAGAPPSPPEPQQAAFQLTPHAVQTPPQTQEPRGGVSPDADSSTSK
ncbi:uncharacterized protein LOC123331058 [Bubalus bubalis]|uniref:uncharacterized protein LOC123331058 n=1 Tax=Bubalus bubalis TaxID=89462 RepID=UPI001E1B81C6|nr:uncharacterized protein LOC123331058 [Bubalus bubalis]